jgi:hypothetical protein
MSRPRRRPAVRGLRARRRREIANVEKLVGTSGLRSFPWHGVPQQQVKAGIAGSGTPDEVPEVIRRRPHRPRPCSRPSHMPDHMPEPQSRRCAIWVTPANLQKAQELADLVGVDIDRVRRLRPERITHAGNARGPDAAAAIRGRG